MKKPSDKTIKQALVLGLVSGMRSTFALAMLSHFISKKPKKRVKKTWFGFIQSPTTAIVTKVLSVGEIVGDKLPDTPNRIAAAPLIARVASGATAGAVISTLNKDELVKGALIGGVAALAGTYACFYLRKAISENTVVKEPWIGALEDAVAISAGVLVMK